jgi:hypothetical protein
MRVRWTLKRSLPNATNEPPAVADGELIAEFDAVLR